MVIPIPKATQRNAQGFYELESLKVKGHTEVLRVSRNTLNSRIRTIQNETSKRFTVREWDDGYRVWRVE